MFVCVCVFIACATAQRLLFGNLLMRLHNLNCFYDTEKNDPKCWDFHLKEEVAVCNQLHFYPTFSNIFNLMISKSFRGTNKECMWMDRFYFMFVCVCIDNSNIII